MNLNEGFHYFGLLAGSCCIKPILPDALVRCRSLDAGLEMNRSVTFALASLYEGVFLDVCNDCVSRGASVKPGHISTGGSASDFRARGPGFDTRSGTFFHFSFRLFKKGFVS